MQKWYCDSIRPAPFVIPAGVISLRRLVHVVNPLAVEPGNASYLDVAQPITLQSMINSKANLENCKGGNRFEILLCSVQYAEDREFVPDDFVKLPDLSRSVLDLPDAQRPGRRLPFIADILGSVNHLELAANDIVVYSNIDIGVCLDFYAFIADQHSRHDAFVINRRDLPKNDDSNVPYTVARLDEIYALSGQKHPGYDCFVFPFWNISAFQLGNVFLGYPPVGNVLRQNIVRQNPTFAQFEDERLTFHMGADRSWRQSSAINDANYALNCAQAESVGYVSPRIRLSSKRLQP